MAAKSIMWSTRAEQDFDQQINYLIEYWRVETAEAFIDQVMSILDAIAASPWKYPAWEEDESVRRCVVNRHITLYYQVQEEQIVLLTFFPTRRDPDELDI